MKVSLLRSYQSECLGWQGWQGWQGWLGAPHRSLEIFVREWEVLHGKKKGPFSMSEFSPLLGATGFPQPQRHPRVCAGAGVPPEPSHAACRLGRSSRSQDEARRQLGQGMGLRAFQVC